ncbi:N-formylglutamate amidohydrolase [Candidatus Azambacteria bacterium]|nr:N-formylglutamate amidohydrolase [Candidatus Azambacteria bacterium]
MERLEDIQKSESHEEYTSKIELSFFRHGEKENNKSKSDLDIELTPVGKKQAKEKSDTKNMKQSVAFGSPRTRAQETAGFVMSGNQEGITGDESLEELREKVDKGLAKGSKIGVDRRLDFGIDFSSEFGVSALDHFKRGDYLKFLVEQSDRLAKESGDETSFTYSRGASNIASIIDKYIGIAKRWDKLVQDEQKEYSDTLERFFGTHQGVNESFLAKVIEKTKGAEERDKFVQALSNQGFDYTEGFEVDILNKNSDEFAIRIRYKKEVEDGDGKRLVFEFNEEIPHEVIKDIIITDEKIEKISQFPFVMDMEKRERPVKVLNALEARGLPTRQSIESDEITPENAVDVDDRALRERECVSVCFGRPHAGEYIPSDLWERATEEGKDTFIFVDRGTSEIFRSKDIPSVGTKLSRFIVDPNRAPLLEQNSKVPGKVLWYKGIRGGTMYKAGQEPTGEEVRNLAEDFYVSYYNKMMGVIGSLADRRGDNERILVIDGHSFPISSVVHDYFKLYGVENPEELPMFIIGDADGTSCDQDIRDAFTHALEKNFNALDDSIKKRLTKHIKGGLVGVNHPFKGAHNVEFYGERQKGVNTFQLECNEAAYMDEVDNNYNTGAYNEENILIIQKLIEKTCKNIDHLLKNNG